MLAKRLRKLKRLIGINYWHKKISKIVASGQTLKVFWYRYILSDYGVLIGNEKYSHINIPTLFIGLGKIKMHKSVCMGGRTCPYFYGGYNYIEARKPQTVIQVEENVFINNGFTLIAEGEGCLIKKNTLVGTNVTIFDSDFHNLHPDKRLDTEGIETSMVVLDENTWIGSNVTILKGVHIGRNSIVAAGSVVTKSFPENCIIAGNPAKIIKMLEV